MGRTNLGTMIAGIALAPAALLLAGCENGGGGTGHPDGVADVVQDSETRAVARPDVQDEGQPDAFMPQRQFVVSVWEGCSASGDCYAYATAGGGKAAQAPESELAVPPCLFIPARLPVQCDPPCAVGTVCDWETGDCGKPVPPVSAGEIEITGLKTTCTLVPETGYYYYMARFEQEPEDGDLFDEGTLITATAPGNEMPGFTISGLGVACVETPLSCPPSLDAAQPLVITWTPSGSAGTVAFSLQSANHAAQFSRIVCETEDTGQLVVDASLLAAFLEGWHPVWSWTLSRQAQTWETVGEWAVGLSVSTSVGCTW